MYVLNIHAHMGCYFLFGSPAPARGPYVHVGFDPCAISFYLPPIKPQSWKPPNLRGMCDGKYDIIFDGRDSGILGIWNILKNISAQSYCREVLRAVAIVSSNGCELKYPACLLPGFGIKIRLRMKSCMFSHPTIVEYHIYLNLELRLNMRS